MSDYVMDIRIDLYCPGCEETTAIFVELTSSDTVQTLMEHIEDQFFCRSCGGKCAGAHRVEFYNEETRYRLPLWKGPVA